MSFHVIHEPHIRRTAVVFDSPHSGITLCDDFHHACSPEDFKHYHDPHVDKLLKDIPFTGAPVLEATIHRICIDLNRFVDEIDTATLKGHWPYPAQKTKFTERNIGLFPVMTGPIWDRTKPVYGQDRPLTAAQARERILLYYRPYYAALNTLMTQASDTHAQSLLVDVHSYYRQDGMPRPDIILGDMNGNTCSPVIMMEAASAFRSHGLSVEFNHPFGNAVIKSAADFSKGHHSLQIEIARDLYMDQKTFEYDENKAAPIKTALCTLSSKLARLMVA